MSPGGFGTAAPFGSSAGFEGDPRGRELAGLTGVCCDSRVLCSGLGQVHCLRDCFFREFNQNRRLKAQFFFHKRSCSHGNLGTIYTRPAVTLEFHFMWTIDIVKEV